jgi:Short C-terminal domain
MMNRSRLLIVFALAITLMAGIVPLIFILGDKGNGLGNGFNIEKLIPLIMVPIVLVIVIISMRPLLRQAFPPSIKNSITADAVVLDVRDTGTTINNDPLVALQLEVRPSMAATFQAEYKTLVSRLEVDQYRPGCKAVVLYDPANPRRMVLQSIDLSAAPAVDAESRLAALNQLREKGLITAEEYQRKREEIIKAL